MVAGFGLTSKNFLLVFLILSFSHNEYTLLYFFKNKEC